MFGKVAPLHVIILMSALTGTASAGVLNAPGDSDFSPPSPAIQRTVDVIPGFSQQQVEMNAGHHEPPTAPLPPAVWPGIAFLVTLGAAKAGLSARRRIVRG